MIDPNFYAKIRQKIAEHGERITATVKNTAEQEAPKPKPRRGRPPKQYADKNSPEAKKQDAQKRYYEQRKDDPEFRKKRNEASLKWYYEHKKTEQKDEP